MNENALWVFNFFNIFHLQLSRISPKIGFLDKFRVQFVFVHVLGRLCFNFFFTQVV